jgi:outer membrane autotransporter protein
MNLHYRTVWNEGLGCCVAAAENTKAPRSGGAQGSRGSRRTATATASAALALVAVAIGGAAQAATFSVANEAQLIAAIDAANASADPTSVITVTKAFTVTTLLPQIKANVTVNAGAIATTIGSAAGASLDVQAGASYQSTGAIRVGNAANTSGTLVAQGSGASVAGSVLQTGPGLATLRVLDGASVVTAGNAELGGNNAASNKGVTNVVVSGTGSTLNIGTGYYQHDGSLQASGGAKVEANVMQLGLSVGDVFTGVVTGPGTVVGTRSGILTLGGYGTANVTVGDGATIKSNNGGSMLVLASQPGSTATLNIGAAAGDAPVAPGLVNALSLNGGSGKATLNFNHNASAYEFAVPITGSVAVNQVGSGTTVLTGANTYGGGTNIAAGTLQVGNGGTTGSFFGNVANNAALVVNRKDALTLSVNISGTGTVQQVGAGTTTLNGTSTYTGGTTVEAGRLVAGSAGAFAQNTAYTVNGGTLDLGTWDLTTSNLSGTGGTVALNARTLTANQAGDSTYTGAITGTGGLVKTGAGALTLSGGSKYSGATNVAGGTLRAGAANVLAGASAFTVAAGATLDLAGNSQTVASVANGGTVSLAGAAPGTTLTVTGPWAGNGGTLRLGTALGGSTSASDRLVLDGATAIASGTTNVQVSNLGGLGALTTGNGIEVISAINGATTTAQTSKSAFALAGGHVDAGAYEYRLHAADASGAGENWYLRSTITVTPPVDPGNPGSPDTPVSPIAPITPIVIPTYRAEASLYAALPSQLRQGNLAMLGDLRKRVGDDDVKGTAATSIGSDRRAWARVLSTDIDIQQGGIVSPTSKGRLTGFQAGTDLLATSNVRAGLYVGQLDGDATVNGFASGVSNLRTGRNDLRSQYVGVYGTFTADSGLYADVVVQSGRHRYTVEPMLGAGIGGKGNSLLGSIEVGQAFALGGTGWSIEPQLQLIHQHMDLSDSAILGAVVQPDADSGWIARAGVRVKGQIDTGMGALQPYGRFNVYRTSSGADIARFVNGATRTDIAAPTGGTSTELAGGFTLALGQTTSLYGEVGKLWSSGGDAKVKSSINGSLGVRVKW